MNGVVGRVGTILHITEGVSSLQLSHTFRGPSPLVYVLLLLPVIPTSAILQGKGESEGPGDMVPAPQRPADASSPHRAAQGPSVMS